MEPSINFQIEAELFKAVIKYPHFTDCFISPHTTDRDIETELKIARHRSDAECDRKYWSVEATLREEVAEAMEAALNHKWVDCKQELAQVAVVCIRAIKWINKEILDEET